MTATSGLRQRKNKKKAKGADKKTKSTAPAPEDPSNNNKDDKEETLWETFIRHPLIQVSIVLLIPYSIYHAYYLLLLQYPPSFLRPAVGISDERQVLIVGTLGSGLVEVASALYRQLKMEVAYQASDTAWHFARDGTVSWWHGIRLFPESQSQRSLIPLCLANHQHQGFHPTMYRSGESGCRSLWYSDWNGCWAKECLRVLEREWGCEWAGGSGHEQEQEEDEYSTSSSSNGAGCLSSFRRTLWQVRHPQRTLETLLQTHCNSSNVLDPLPNEQIRFLLGNMTAKAAGTKTLPSTHSCLETLALHVISYNTAMLTAYKDGRIDEMFHVENTTVCAVAEKAGFGDRDAVVYAPNAETMAKQCQEWAPQATIRLKETKEQLVVNWKDVWDDSHKNLETELQEIALQLGYPTTAWYSP